MKKILFGDEARIEIKKGLDQVADAVKLTLGPTGRNACYDKGYGGPVISNDGVSIAREIILEDPIQNMGASVAKEVAEKTNESAGDGTTTSVILTQAIFSEGLKKISVGVNAIGIKNGLNKASKIAVDFLKSISKPIKSDSETAQVAAISAESEEVGKMIAETISKLGVDAVLSVEESPIVGITSEVSTGMEFDKGFISPYMITNQDRGEAECRDVFILVTDQKVGAIQEMIPILEEVGKTGKKEIVIIADDVVGESLQTFIINKLRGSLFGLCIKAPGFGNRKKDYLEDIAILTGATLITGDIGLKLENIKLEHLGRADRVTCTKDKTTIVGGKGDKKKIEERISIAKKELETLESKHDRLKTEERIAKLSGGVAVIKVGASTETETKYQKLKIEDACNAVKAALLEGVVPGGGVALLLASNAVLEAKKKGVYTQDELIGFDILVSALQTPLYNIAINCGLGDGSMVVSKVKEMKMGGGFDALNNKYVLDLFEAGIIDPLKVTRSAVENSVSAGGALLTTGVGIAEIKKEKSDTM